MSNGTEGVDSPPAPPAAASAEAPKFAPCANCNHPRNSRYCPKCGQNDRDYIRSLPPLLGDILKETFELDGRIRRTIKPLFLRPGELPSEFSRNRRARYVSPIRLYLVASIGFFFLISVVGDVGRPQSNPMLLAEPQQLVAARQDADIDALKALLPVPQQYKVDALLARPGMFVSKSLLYQLSASVDELAPCHDCWRAEWDRFVLARIVDVLEDPAEGLSLLLDSLPFAMFVTLPAYALLLMLFFAGSRRYYTEHLVFAVQLHTFAFIIFAATMAIPDDDPPPSEMAEAPSIAIHFGTGEEEPGGVRVGIDAAQEGTDAASPQPAERVPLARPARLRAAALEKQRQALERDAMDIVGWIELGLFLWVLAYHYLALRRYYGNGRRRTAWKCVALTFSYGILLIPGILLSASIAMVRLG